MKGKPTWKPVGLRAKRCREPAQSKTPADLLPLLKVPPREIFRKVRPHKWQPEIK